jgi:predicted alpha/beta hydrolase
MNFLSEGRDFGGFLAARGFDVWLVEYRGDRSSRPPSAAAFAAGAWSVDELARIDVPAAMDHIAAATGRDRVFCVGHSLGGTLALISAQGPVADRVAGVVAIGAPGAFTRPHASASRILSLSGLVPKRGHVPARSLAGLSRGLLSFAPDAPLLHLIFDVENVDPVSLMSFVRDGMEDISAGVAQHYVRWAEGGTLVSMDGRENWTEGLARVTAPAMFVAGRTDGVVPVWNVRAGYDRVSSPDKSWVVLGRGWGTAADYGHGDLLVGDRVGAELFPLVADWLAARSR